ncbi:hypothetical protein CL621_01365 [archaeon]|nr:hypothetical protein [archaeon]
MDKPIELNKPIKNFFYCSAVDGCASNSHLGMRIIKFLKENNYQLVTKSKFADIIFINTCIAVNHTEKISKKTIEFFINKYGSDKNKKIVVCGCLPKVMNIENENVIKIKNISEINKLIDTKKKIEDIKSNRFNKGLYRKYEDDEFYIQICSGCLGNCNYCIIKSAIGNLKSRSREDIIKEFKKGIESGYKKFVLWGDDCGCYGKDIGTNFTDLFKTFSEISDEAIFKIVYFEPNWLIEQYQGLKQFIKNNRIYYINIPLQSGSNNVINLMGRHYDINKTKEILKEIKEISPNIFLETCILFGFPGETHQDFLDSIEAGKYFDCANFIVFSERPNTKAAKMKNKVSKNIKIERGEFIKEIIKKYPKKYTVNDADDIIES